MSILQRRFASVAAVALGVVAGSSWFALPTNAALIHESATLGATGQNTGLSILPGIEFPVQYLGSRFSVSSTVNVDSIGGHIFGAQPFGNDLLFGAIIGLSSSTALPTGNPFGVGEVLASTTFNPVFPSSDVMVPLSLTLAPGDYAVVFGSGLFGATGRGAMPGNDTDISGSASYFRRFGGNWFDGGFDNTRFTVGGTVSPVPLPAALPLFLSALAGLGLMGWRRRRADA